MKDVTLLLDVILMYDKKKLSLLLNCANNSADSFSTNPHARKECHNEVY